MMKNSIFYTNTYTEIETKVKDLLNSYNQMDERQRLRIVLKIGNSEDTVIGEA